VQRGQHISQHRQPIHPAESRGNQVATHGTWGYVAGGNGLTLLLKLGELDRVLRAVATSRSVSLRAERPELLREPVPTAPPAIGR